MTARRRRICGARFGGPPRRCRNRRTETTVTIKTGQKLPRLELPLVGGGTRVLDDLCGGRFVVLVFYRGSHCRRCNPYLNVFQSLLAKFRALGAEVVAVSADEKCHPYT